MMPLVFATILGIWVVIDLLVARSLRRRNRWQAESISEWRWRFTEAAAIGEEARSKQLAAENALRRRNKDLARLMNAKAVNVLVFPRRTTASAELIHDGFIDGMNAHEGMIVEASARHFGAVALEELPDGAAAEALAQTHDASRRMSIEDLVSNVVHEQIAKKLSDEIGRSMTEAATWLRKED